MTSLTACDISSSLEIRCFYKHVNLQFFLAYFCYQVLWHRGQAGCWWQLLSHSAIVWYIKEVAPESWGCPKARTVSSTYWATHPLPHFLNTYNTRVTITVLQWSRIQKWVYKGKGEGAERTELCKIIDWWKRGFWEGGKVEGTTVCHSAWMVVTLALVCCNCLRILVSAEDWLCPGKTWAIHYSQFRSVLSHETSAFSHFLPIFPWQAAMCILMEQLPICSDLRDARLQSLLAILDHRGSDTDFSVHHFFTPPLDCCRPLPFRLKCLLGDSLTIFLFLIWGFKH